MTTDEQRIEQIKNRLSYTQGAKNFSKFGRVGTNYVNDVEWLMEALEKEMNSYECLLRNYEELQEAAENKCNYCHWKNPNFAREVGNMR